MRYTILSLFYFFTLNILAQETMGGGTFPEYEKNGIESIQEFHSYIPLNDTILKKRHSKTLIFNKKGQLIKEFFNPYRKYGFYYSYNSKGFLTDIDTVGILGISSTSSKGRSPMDTTFQTIIKEEKRFQIDTINRLYSTKLIYKELKVESLVKYTYDEEGRLKKEFQYSKKEDSQNELISVTEYLYNELGFISQITHLNNNGNILKKEEFIYKHFE